MRYLYRRFWGFWAERRIDSLGARALESRGTVSVVHGGKSYSCKEEALLIAGKLLRDFYGVIAGAIKMTVLLYETGGVLDGFVKGEVDNVI
jgi:hypothetical protein